LQISSSIGVGLLPEHDGLAVVGYRRLGRLAKPCRAHRRHRLAPGRRHGRASLRCVRPCALTPPYAISLEDPVRQVRIPRIPRPEHLALLPVTRMPPSRRPAGCARYRLRRRSAATRDTATATVEERATRTLCCSRGHPAIASCASKSAQFAVT